MGGDFSGISNLVGALSPMTLWFSPWLPSEAIGLQEVHRATTGTMLPSEAIGLQEVNRATTGTMLPSEALGLQEEVDRATTGTMLPSEAKGLQGVNRATAVERQMYVAPTTWRHTTTIT